MERLRTYKVFGRKFRAHNSACADGFKEDRRHGLIYGPIEIVYPDGTRRLAMNQEEASVECDFCAYCGK